MRHSQITSKAMLREGESRPGGQDTELSPDQKALLQRTKEAVMRHAMRASLAPEGPKLYVAKLRLMGGIWWDGYLEARAQTGLTVDEVSSRTGADPDEVSLFFAGGLDPMDLREGFIEVLAQSLGRPDILERHKVLFGGGA